MCILTSGDHTIEKISIIMPGSLALVTTENLPYSPRPCAGGGVRISGLGDVLKQSGVDCTYWLLEDWRGSLDPRFDFPVEFYRPEQLHQLLNGSNHDAVLFEQWQPLTYLKEPLKIPVIVDLPGPLMMEYHWRDPDNYLQHMTDKLFCLAQADYAVCADERQRGYYSAWLSWAGWDPSENRLRVAPFCMREMPKSRQGHVEDEPLFLWGGMFWPWHDRRAAFQCVVDALQKADRGQLAIVGANGDEESLGPFYQSYAQHNRVSWLGQYAFTDYVTELKRSAVALDLSAPTEERRLSSDLRTGTALWAGTPCIVTPESAWARMIEQHNAGWVVSNGDHKQLSSIVAQLALERCDLVAKRRGASAASVEISQESRIKPLLDLLESPTKRPANSPLLSSRDQDREQRLLDLQESVFQLQHENECLKHDLESIRKNPLFRLYKNLIGLLK
ncbi:MAG: hypothetical protein P9L94_20070 [Candidatus Hinthialibacter antarcticus]|nr:hypothetical protein [Candidatus Hinthialibacter antarcticus]